MDLAMGGWWIVCLKCITWLFILTLNQGECLRPLRNEAGLFSSGTPKVRDVSARSIVYKTKYIEQPVDHFGYANQDSFNLRYLVADQFWDKKHGPVFFYTGNEGDIDWFCNNTGFMWDIAPEFNAMLIFAEHRYYGTSMPYGNDSYKDPQHLGYLTSEQALADFATLISDLKKNDKNLAKAPFIAFGGSYGGMLAAWMRMKYPHLIQGSLASSAPIWYFGDLTPCDAFYQITTKDFSRESTACSANIRRSWDVITEMGKSDVGRQKLSSIFKLCKPLSDEAGVSALKEWLSGTYGNLAMVDYPYEANFLEPLPAWPIKAACKYLDHGSGNGSSLLVGVANAVGVYFNYTGSTKCFSTSQEAGASLGDLGWSFQACTEMVMPMCTTGKDDMFEPSPWNITAVSKGCKKQWGVTPRPTAVLIEYGGKMIKTASNIIFSNGNLDPWSGAGVLTSLSDTLVAIIIEDGAHHLDLRGSNPKDPPSVIAARQQEKDIIKSWVQHHQSKKSTDRAAFGRLPPARARGLGAGYSLTAAVIVFGFAISLTLLALKVSRRNSSYTILSQQRPSASWFDGAEAPTNGSNSNTEKTPLLT